jgi:hypothetical protein
MVLQWCGPRSWTVVSSSQIQRQNDYGLRNSNVLSCQILTCALAQLDCGIHPAKNGRASLPYTDNIMLDEVDLLLVSHFHLDHCGALPWLLTKAHPNPCIHSSIHSFIHSFIHFFFRFAFLRPRSKDVCTWPSPLEQSIAGYSQISFESGFLVHTVPHNRHSFFLFFTIVTHQAVIFCTQTLRLKAQCRKSRLLASIRSHLFRCLKQLINYIQASTHVYAHEHFQVYDC